ncbi:hypothetical protein QBC33DRAFT_548231 [Phialemonium atrogriseum]|uniref:Uncharacterized protein n=1 Tax=Phialemonium atrogriseum TaxID=1093897 RepID=A0AAJ0BTE4_9PEZI|nr:uncharacterized protein QBC33DRAFT_548231 [Phialemonium atrogriseum]KAK1764154.1 hypothetical protein QBC33DRAFT_548231 [Phialemonium atrogriseum]
MDTGTTQPTNEHLCAEDLGQSDISTCRNDNSPGPVTDATVANVVRIVVRCASHKVPGPPMQRARTMANIICQHQWGRDMDWQRETIRTRGCWEADGEKVRFLLDSGPPGVTPDLERIPVLMYKWTGEKLVERDLDARTKHCLDEEYQFKENPRPPRDPSKSWSMAQLREQMDDKAWDNMMEQLISHNLRLGRIFSTTEVQWVEDHLDTFDSVMGQHIGRKRWKRLHLKLSEVLWLGAHPEVPLNPSKPSDMALFRAISEQRCAEIQAASEAKVPNSVVQPALTASSDSTAELGA